MEYNRKILYYRDAAEAGKLTQQHADVIKRCKEKRGLARHMHSEHSNSPLILAQGKKSNDAQRKPITICLRFGTSFMHVHQN
jgi:hypothetical protein